MVRFRISNLARHPALAVVLRYGLAFASVAAAMGLSLILIHSGLPRLFGAFSFVAIAIAFWFGGTGPGLLSVLLSTLAFSFFLFPVTEVRGPGWQSFLAIYAMFGGLVGWFSASRHRAERLLAEARDNLEMRVAERTSELARAEQELRRSEEHLRLVIDTVPALIHTGRPDGYLDYFNRRWLDYVGLPLEEISGWKWVEVNHPEDVTATVEEWRRCIATGEPYEHESRLRRADGEYRWMIHRKVPLRDERGNIVKWYGSSVDIEDRKRAEEGLRAVVYERAHLSAVRAEIGMALARKDSLREILRLCAEAIVQHLDAAFARIWTLSTNDHELELQASAGMYTRLDGGYSRIPLGEIKVGQIAQERKAHLTNDVQSDPRIKDKDWAKGEKITSFAGYPLVVEGRTVGVMGMFSQKPLSESTLDTLSILADGIAQGIERKRAEEELQRSEAFLAEGQRLTRTGSWAYNPSGFFDHWSQEMFRIYGFDPANGAPTLAQYLGAIHPQDREFVAGTIEKTLAQGTDYDVKKRILRPDGELRYIRCVGAPVFDNGILKSVVGTAMDVTAQEQLTQALQRSFEEVRMSEARLNLVVSQLPAVLWSTDKELRFTSHMGAGLRVLGIGPNQLVGKTADQYMLSLGLPLGRPDPRRALAGESLNYEVIIQGRDYDVHVEPLRNAAGEITGTVGISLDVTERMRAEEALQRSHDQLRALAARVEKVREEERTRLAREIHDGLGQALTAIKIDLSSLCHDMPAEKQHQSESIMKLADETIRSVRRISTELRPAVLDTLGPVAAVEWAAEEFEARTGIKCRLDLPLEDIVIDQERATALFRIFQETLTNVARHANATEVNVRLAEADGNLSLEVHDNGKGVSEAQISAGTSLGILGMRERALLLGGEFTITGALGEGTTVRVRIPGPQPTPPKDRK